MAASKPTSWLYQFENPLSPLVLYLRTLANDLGCFPLVPGPSHPGTDSFVSMYYIHIMLCFRSFLELGRVEYPPHPLSALHHNIITKGFTSIDFAENQLSPSLISLSPLCTSHPRLLPQAWVQPSMVCYDKFQLAHA